MNSKISLIVDCLTASLLDVTVLKSVDHIEVFNDNNSIVGTSFQYATILDVLERSEVGDHPVKNWLRSCVLKNYENIGFNYFDHPLIPDDLDTASAMVRATNNSEMAERFIELTEQHTSDGQVSTWFVNNNNYNLPYFKNTAIYRNREFYHMEVLLNYLYTKKVTLGLSIDNELHKYIHLFGFNNYWYIPTLYTISFASKLLKYTTNSKINRVIYKCVLEYISNESHGTFISTTNSFAHVKDEFNSQSINDRSWLNLGFLIATLQNIVLYGGVHDVRITDALDLAIERMNSSFMQTELPLYWSFNKSFYRSSIFEKALLLNMLT